LAELALRTEGVTKTFGAFKAVDTVSIKLPNGSITLLAGPNGSGKTTLANLISGYYKPDSGTVHFNGADITGETMNDIYKRGLVRTFQIPAPFGKLSVNVGLCGAETFKSSSAFLAWLSSSEIALSPVPFG
jgi:branched-chain amino acid transport system ATP-binding protein